MLMKKIIYSVFISILTLTSCEKDLSVYKSDVSQLNFKYSDRELTTGTVTEDMRKVSYSFVLNAKEGVTVDTVWLNVTTMGYLSDKKRGFELKQIILEDEENAEPDKHFVSFDDESLKSEFYFIAPNESQRSIPIIVLRDNSLTEKGDVKLKLTFKENENFKCGYPEFSEYTVTISDRLAEPSMWSECSLDYYFGNYGAKKHELMIAWTGEAWDDNYLLELFYFSDYGYSTHIYIY